MKPSITAAIFFALACRGEAAIRIESDRYTVDVDASNGTFAIATKPDGKCILPSGKLSGAGGTAKIVEFDDEAFGTGQRVEVTYPDGNRENVAVYAKLPFVTFRSTLHNGGSEPAVLSHVSTVSAAIDLGIPVSGITTLGTGGLLAPENNRGSYAFLSIVNPQFRCGVVGGWLTHDRGSGVVFSTVAVDTVRMQAQIDYGRLTCPHESRQFLS